MAAEPNGLDVLIADEAHRIRETSANRYTRAEHRTGAAADRRAHRAARVPVFLLDEHQVVRPGEMGTVEDIEAHAASAGLDVQQIDLDAQFRCGGSAGVRRVGGAAARPRARRPDPVEAATRTSTSRSPTRPPEMEARSSRPSSRDGYGARMAAGYCWPWSDPRPDGSLVPDVQIGDWSRPWNLKGERSVGGAPPAALWATDPAGFGQVGCVYTAQGFEYDWNGVILGPDLVWRDDRWIAVRSANKDPDFRNRTKVSDARVRPPGPQRLQGAADPRHARRGHLLPRRGDARVLRNLLSHQIFAPVT